MASPAEFRFNRNQEVLYPAVMNNIQLHSNPLLRIPVLNWTSSSGFQWSVGATVVWPDSISVTFTDVRKGPSRLQHFIPDDLSCERGKGLVDEYGNFTVRRNTSRRCVWCKPGYFSKYLDDTKGLTRECQPCRPGKSQPDQGEGRCVECRAGTYANKAGSPECISGEAGRLSFSSPSPGKGDWVA